MDLARAKLERDASTACTPGKAFEMPVATTIGAAWAFVGSEGGAFTGTADMSTLKPRPPAVKDVVARMVSAASAGGELEPRPGEGRSHGQGER